MITRPIVNQIYGSPLFLVPRGSFWNCQWITENGRSEDQQLEAVLWQVEFQHRARTLVFESPQTLEAFLADENPVFEAERRLITLARPYRQRIALTLDEVAAQAEAQSPGTYQRLRGGSKAHRVFGGRIAANETTTLAAPLFDLFGSDQLLWCPKGLLDENYTYHFVRSLQRDSASRDAFHRLPQTLIAPTRTTLNRGRIPTAYTVDLADGYYVLVPADRGLSSVVASAHHGRIQVEVDDEFDYGAYKNIQVDSFFIRDTIQERPKCCLDAKPTVTDRSLAVDVLSAGS